MRTLSLMVGLCLGASAWANVPINEPVEPISPAEITDPAKVELGKQLATSIEKELLSDKQAEHDASTENLIQYYKQHSN